MKVILDFDRVIFNTQELVDRMRAANIKTRDPHTFALLKEHDPDFTVESLLYPSAKTFLETYGQHCTILTSATVDDTDAAAAAEQLRFQKQKLHESGVEQFVGQGNITLVTQSKKSALAELRALYADDCVFVDDKEEFIREAEEVGVAAIWMDREGRGVNTNSGGVSTMLGPRRVENFQELIPILVEEINRSSESQT